MATGCWLLMMLMTMTTMMVVSEDEGIGLD